MQLRVRYFHQLRRLAPQQALVVLCAGLALLSGCVQTGSSGTFERPVPAAQTAPEPAVKASAPQPAPAAANVPAAGPPASVTPASVTPEWPSVPPPAPNAATGATGRGAMAVVGLSAASASLMSSANHHAAVGDLGAAAADIERALRLEPAQPRLWLELGELRLRQGQRDQARNMARKALTLAGNDEVLRARTADLLRRSSH